MNIIHFFLLRMAAFLCWLFYPVWFAIRLFTWFVFGKHDLPQWLRKEMEVDDDD